MFCTACPVRSATDATARKHCGANRHAVRANFAEMRIDRLPISVLRTRFVPGGWDLLAFVLVFAFFIYAAQAAHGLIGSLAGLEATPISLAPSALVGYSARTALRMLIAMVASLVFTFTYATLAAKSRRAEVILVPLLDFLQSVPILSFSVTILFFLQLT